MGKFTPGFFKSKYGNLAKVVNGKKYTIGGFFDLMLASTPENPAPYPFKLNVEDCFPELLREMKPEIIYAKSDRIHHPLLQKFMLKGAQVYELFLGGRGSFFPLLHTDVLGLHTQITQLHGSKEFILYSPDQTKFMYPNHFCVKVAGNFSRLFNVIVNPSLKPFAIIISRMAGVLYFIVILTVVTG